MEKGNGIKREQQRIWSLSSGSVTVLYGVFALTGFSTALLGATLPVMKVHWHLTDRGSGLLFLALFLGTSSGALLSRGRITHSLARGIWLLAPACIALGIARGLAVFAFCYLYGFGLGMAMTSITMLRSLRRESAPVRELNRMNLIWAMGAFLSPALANGVIRYLGVRIPTLFLGLGLIFAIAGIWAVGVEARIFPSPSRRYVASHYTRRQLPWTIGAMTFLAVGLESATGAWIASYSHRLSSGFKAPVEAASIFWFGLLASRALYSTNFLRALTERERLRWPILSAAAGSAIMLGSQGQVLLVVAALFIGFGVGPIYPTLLGLTLPRVAGNLIFLLAGLGGSSFSWLTGMIAVSASSLRVGMLVPAIAGAVMLAISPSLFASLESLEEADCKAQTTA